MVDAHMEAKIDQMWEAISRLEKRVAEISAREPGKIRTDHPHIVRVEGVCGGHPVIEGTRLSVKLIVGWAQMEMTAKEIAAQYPHVSVVQIADALAYYEDHPEEIDAEFAEEARYLEVEIPRLQAMIAERRKSKGESLTTSGILCRYSNVGGAPIDIIPALSFRSKFLSANSNDG